MTTDQLAALLHEADVCWNNEFGCGGPEDHLADAERLLPLLAAAGVTVAQPDHSDGCAGNCGTNDYDNPPCPAQDRCRVEPAFSQHEYAVAYCETHDQPADMCDQPAPDIVAAERLRYDLKAFIHAFDAHDKDMLANVFTVARQRAMRLLASLGTIAAPEEADRGPTLHIGPDGEEVI